MKNAPPTVTPDIKPGSVAIVQKKRLRWPSNYRWKQLRKSVDPEIADRAKLCAAMWFSTPGPVTLPAQDAIAGQVAFDFLKRASA